MMPPMLRKIFRGFVPRREHPLLDRVERDAEDLERERRYLEEIGAERSEPFVAARYYEGVRWRGVLSHYVSPHARLLDLGAGNGAIEFALHGYRAVSLDAEWNDVARRLGVRRVIGDASRLPFRDGVFDAVMLLETVEHLAAPREVARELARVAADGAHVLVTTPPRWRYAFRGDPHFSIPGLVLAPPSLQRSIAARRGFGARHHYVDRIYSSVPQLARALEPLRVHEVLSRSRLPRRWFWDALILKNERPPEGGR